MLLCFEAGFWIKEGEKGLILTDTILQGTIVRPRGPTNFGDYLPNPPQAQA